MAEYISQLVVAVDFNGTVFDHRGGYNKDRVDPNAPEIPGAIAWLKATSEELDVFLVSASFARSSFVASAKAWLESKGIPRAWMTPRLEGASRITLTPFKPKCLLFIDDRGWRFDGAFPTVDQIKSFKPWNR